MFKHILVPLDESTCAEQALPLAAQLARTSGATLTLLHVLPYALDYPVYSMAPGALTQDIIDMNEKSAKNYFTRICAQPLLKDIPLKTAIMHGNPPQLIVQSAELAHEDLIVMCSHGRTGLKRLVQGSVAQQVARYSAIPVLILHEQLEQPTAQTTTELEQKPFRVLIALDGSQQAETVIQPAAELSALLSYPQPGNLHLIRIVRPILPLDTLDSKTIARVNKDAYTQAEEYLEGLTRRIFLTIAPNISLDVNFSVRHDEDVAARLVSVVAAENLMEVPPLSAIAVATHGRNGIPRWLLGSVTEEILHRTTLPVLVLKHAEEDKNRDKGLSEAATLKHHVISEYHPLVSL
jgi:nucleotide-binding universal stress UspA family protein